MTLYGRASLTEAVARAEARLTFLVGDSGVGKTRVLEAAAATREGWLNASPRRLGASADAIRRSFLDALADVVGQIAEETSAVEELGERLARTADRFTRETTKELGRALASELREVVRGRLGPESGRALTRFIQNFREEGHNTTAARIAAFAAESVAEVLASLATEVTVLAEGRRVGLHFDFGERLNDDESRLLVDIADRLPDRCHMRVAFRTSGTSSTARVARLAALAPSTHQIEVQPLRAADIEEWLHDAGVDASIPAVMQATRFPDLWATFGPRVRARTSRTRVIR